MHDHAALACVANASSTIRPAPWPGLTRGMLRGTSQKSARELIRHGRALAYLRGDGG